MEPFRDAARAGPAVSDLAAERSMAALRALFDERLGRDVGVRLWNGTNVSAPNARFELIARTPFALRAAFTPPLDVNPGRAFVESWIDVTGDLEAAIDTLERRVAQLPKLVLARLATLLVRLPSPPKVRGDGGPRLGGNCTRRRATPRPSAFTTICR